MKRILFSLLFIGLVLSSQAQILHASSYGQQSSWASLDPLTVRYINQIKANGGTLSTASKNAIDVFVKGIRTAGIRTNIIRFNPMKGNGLLSLVIPLITSNTDDTTTVIGSAKDVNNGFVAGDYNETGTSAGLKGNGTKYIDITVNPSTATALDINHAGLLVTVLANKIDTVQYNTNNYIASLGSTYMNISNTTNYFESSSGLTNFNMSGFSQFDQGIHGLLQVDATHILPITNGVDEGQLSYTVASKPNANLYLFKFSTLYSNAIISNYAITTGMTEAQMITFENLINALNKSFSQPYYTTDYATFVGNSITYGFFVNNYSRWSSLLSIAKGWTENNQGINSTVLQHTDGLANNMYGRYASYINSTSKKGWWFIAGGINDLRYNGVNFTSQKFSDDLDTMVSTLIRNGVSPSKIVIVGPYFYDHAGSKPQDSPGNATPPWNAGSVAKSTDYDSKCQAVATLRGVYFVNTNTFMSNSGGVTLVDPNDGLHPTQGGHQVIVRAILNVIGR